MSPNVSSVCFLDISREISAKPCPSSCYCICKAQGTYQDGDCSWGLPTRLSLQWTLPRLPPLKPLFTSHTRYMWALSKEDIKGGQKMKCMQLNPLPAELLMYHIHQELINRDTSITLIMASIIRMSLLNCAPPADRAPSVPRKPHIHLVPRLESLLSGFSCPCVWFGEQ